MRIPWRTCAVVGIVVLVLNKAGSVSYGYGTDPLDASDYPTGDSTYN